MGSSRARRKKVGPARTSLGDWNGNFKNEDMPHIEIPKGGSSNL
jgi:hypothetical protein